MATIRTLLPLAVCLAACQLPGQEVRVRVAMEKPPHYVGRPAVIQFTVEGFDLKPLPTVELEPLAPGLRGRTVVNNPSVYSGYTSINGRVTEYSRVTHFINYLVTADEPGDYEVGPFVIKQGAKESRIKALPVSFESVPEDPDVRIRLLLPEGNIYPDQRVPVQIEWWYAGDIEDVQDLSIYSPLFEQFRFAPDEQPRRGRSRLPIETGEERLGLDADTRQEQYEGRTFNVFTARRTLIPDRVGQFQLAPITATLVKATSWVRQRSPLDGLGFDSSLLDDMMGDRRKPSATKLTRAVGEAKTLIVKPFPLEGQPESFAGAVGDGFSIDVAADRTVVRVGDPIGLDVALRGKGNLENASLPPLSADGGLDPAAFRLPEGDVPGTLAEGVKQFQVSLRVTDESVTEIPALAYSWFNPETETYQTARSKPIALRVMPAQVISAGDVVSGSKSSERPDPKGYSDASDQPKQVAAAGNEPRFSLNGADLAIEPLAGVVLRDAGGWAGGLPMQLALYGTGLLLILVALVDRRRSDVDPAIVARRKNIRRQQERIAQAARLPSKQAAAEIAEAMRTLVAEQPDLARVEAQGVIASCESIVFAPAEPGDAQLDKALIERAKSVAAKFKESPASKLP